MSIQFHSGVSTSQYELKIILFAWLTHLVYCLVLFTKLEETVCFSKLEETVCDKTHCFHDSPVNKLKKVNE